MCAEDAPIMRRLFVSNSRVANGKRMFMRMRIRSSLPCLVRVVLNCRLSLFVRFHVGDLCTNKIACCAAQWFYNVNNIVSCFETWQRLPFNFASTLWANLNTHSAKAPHKHKLCAPLAAVWPTFALLHIRALTVHG